MTAELSEFDGQVCDQVWFVQDYVQIWFHDAGLTLIAPPVVVEGDRLYRFPEEGSRDALCRLIDATAVMVERTEEGIRVRFSSGAILVVEPDPDHPDWDVWDVVERRW